MVCHSFLSLPGGLNAVTVILDTCTVAPTIEWGIHCHTQNGIPLEIKNRINVHSVIVPLQKNYIDLTLFRIVWEDER